MNSIEAGYDNFIGLDWNILNPRFSLKFPGKCTSLEPGLNENFEILVKKKRTKSKPMIGSLVKLFKLTKRIGTECVFQQNNNYS